MTTNDDAVTEADLLAYVDGRLDERRIAQVDAYLASNPQEAERVGRWRDQNDAIHRLYDPAGEEPLPARLDVRRLETAAHFPKDWRRMAAAAIVCLAIGGMGGWYGRTLVSVPAPAGSPLLTEAVDAHSLYAGEVVHPVEVRAGQQDHLAAWLSKRLDRPIEVPDLRKAGFNLVGGRLLPAGAKPAAQFMYEDKSGRRVTLYIVPEARGRDTAFRFAQLDRLSAFYWRDETIGCALVGDLPRDDLHDLALQAYRQLA